MFGYKCKNDHVTQDETTDSPEIVCPVCQEDAYWQALDCTLNINSLSKIVEEHAIEKMSDHAVTRWGNQNLVCDICGASFQPNRKGQTTCNLKKCKKQHQIAYGRAYREKKRLNVV